MPSSANDRESLRRAREGDRSAFAELVERHYPLLLASCRRALSDADLARDAAQQATLSAMLGLDRLRDDERFGAWLIGIGLNVCRALLRDRGRYAAWLDAVDDDRGHAQQCEAGPDPALRAENEDIGARVRNAIAALPPGQRDAVALFYLGGLTHAEIADQLGTRPGAIKTRLYKARHSMRGPLNELWKEHFAVTTDHMDLVPMHIADLRRSSRAVPESARTIVFLEEDGGGRRLPIWIGTPEASALAVLLEGVALPRPGIHAFAASLLGAAGGRLREVRIVKLTDFIFYAQAVLADGSTVDARPSDALALALHLSAPIYVAEAVLEQAGRSSFELAEDDLHEDVKEIADETRARLEADADVLATLRRSSHQ